MNKPEIVRFVCAFLLASIILTLIGSVMNSYAVETNNGLMPLQLDHPVNLPSTEVHSYFYDKEEVNNYWLTDIFPLHLSGKVWKFSFGDFLIWTGMVIWGLAFILFMFMIPGEVRDNKKNE